MMLIDCDSIRLKLSFQNNFVKIKKHTKNCKRQKTKISLINYCSVLQFDSGVQFLFSLQAKCK